MKRGIILMIPVLFAAAAAFGQTAWPPVLNKDNNRDKAYDGRKIEKFDHRDRSDWGYPNEKNERKNYLYVVSPLEPKKDCPLIVILHSANRDADAYVDAETFKKPDPKEIGGCSNVPDGFYGLFLNSTNQEWWGAGENDQGKEFVSNMMSPTEKRVLDSIDWAVQKYKIDKNRIYLQGMSMGGCGALGIGMNHGNIFAAVRVWVPAGVNFVSHRMGFDGSDKSKWPKKVNETLRYDPPPLVDFSATNDNWSKDQGLLLNAARECQFLLIFGWGPFGHTGSRNDVTKFPGPALVYNFPWLEIRKNEAYPVFTNATSDRKAKWLDNMEPDDYGQINSWFRWNNKKDTRNEFAINLWLENNLTSTKPQSSTVDITFRRMQNFKPVPFKSYEWALKNLKEEVLSKGSVKANAYSQLTIPQVQLTGDPAQLTVK